RNTIFVISLEINDSVFFLSAAAVMSYCDFSLTVTSGMFFNRYYKGFLGSGLCDLREIRAGHMSSGRCIWVIGFDIHYIHSFQVSIYYHAFIAFKAERIRAFLI